MLIVHFDERDDAEHFASALSASNISWQLIREEFAGEEDAEDAAWLVEVAAANAEVLELAAKLGGWVISSATETAQGVPQLPGEPRRFKQEPPAR